MTIKVHPKMAMEILVVGKMQVKSGGKRKYRNCRGRLGEKFKCSVNTSALVTDGRLQLSDE